MALFATHKTKKGEETKFGVGDVVKVYQKVKEGEKTRVQIFEGVVMGIRGREDNKSFTVRRIGAQKIGIERIFPLLTPVVEKIEVVKKGTRGVRRAKLFYTREKSRKERELIYSRSTRRENAKKAKKVKAVSKKKTVAKAKPEKKVVAKKPAKASKSVTKKK